MADFRDRFCSLLESLSFNDTEVAAILGVSKQTVSAWRSGTRSPKRPTIVAIASHFGVSVPWLMGQTESMSPDSPSVPADPLTPDEGELLGCYRAVNREGRTVILGTARAVAGNPEMQKSAASSETA